METRGNSKEVLTKLNVRLQEINFAITKISNLVPTEALHNQIILYKHKLQTYRKELDELIHQYDHQQATLESTTESMDIEMKALMEKAKQLKVIGEQEIAKQNSGKVYFQDVERKIVEAIGEIEKFNEKSEEMKQVLIRKYQTYLNELEVQLNTLIHRFDPK